MNCAAGDKYGFPTLFFWHFFSWATSVVALDGGFDPIGFPKEFGCLLWLSTSRVFHVMVFSFLAGASSYLQ